jgi:hypothetical protein
MTPHWPCVVGGVAAWPQRLSAGVVAQWIVELLDESSLVAAWFVSTAGLLWGGCGTRGEGLLGVWCVGTLLGPEITPVWCCSVPGPDRSQTVFVVVMGAGGLWWCGCLVGV